MEQQDWLNLNQLMTNVRSISSQQKKDGKLISMFSITERNEESERTGGTCSLLSNVLKADNEEFLRSQLNRYSFLS